MAPFCAHDCLHMHWRWSASVEKKWNLGWGTLGPFSEAGAPLVPPEQDVWLGFRARAAFTYHVVSRDPRMVDGWHVLMHHGFGYAVSIHDTFSLNLAMLGTDQFSSLVFVGKNGDNIDARDSTAAYYWKARYEVEVVDGKARPRERLYPAGEELLDQAIDL